jgi:hypothetical protein
VYIHDTLSSLDVEKEHPPDPPSALPPGSSGAEQEPSMQSLVSVDLSVETAPFFIKRPQHCFFAHHHGAACRSGEVLTNVHE